MTRVPPFSIYNQKERDRKQDLINFFVPLDQTKKERAEKEEYYSCSNHT